MDGTWGPKIKIDSDKELMEVGKMAVHDSGGGE